MNTDCWTFFEYDADSTTRWDPLICIVDWLVSQVDIGALRHTDFARLGAARDAVVIMPLSAAGEKGSAKWLRSSMTAAYCSLAFRSRVPRSFLRAFAETEQTLATNDVWGSPPWGFGANIRSFIDDCSQDASPWCILGHDAQFMSLYEPSSLPA